MASMGQILDTIERNNNRQVTPLFKKNRRIFEDIRGYEQNRKNPQEMEFTPRRITLKGVYS